MNNSPCKNCPDRKPATADTVSCHAECEKDKAYAESRRVNSETKLAQLRGEYSMSPQKKKAVIKKMRWK